MIKLKEILHLVKKENKEGYINIDDWKWPDVDHLMSMGFDFTDDYHMQTNKGTNEDGTGKITIYKKRNKDENGKEKSFFFIEEENREAKRFSNFNDVIDYFDTYSQPEIDKNL